VQRYFIYFSYNGTHYHGWQNQPNGISVQEMLEKALSTVLRTDTQVVGAGRTDSGVHARLMVAHFNASTLPDLLLFSNKLNSILPNDIAVYKVVKVTENAHARFDAISRRYEYHLVTEKSVFRNGLAARFANRIDFDKMNEAAALLPGYTDFTSFSKLHTDVKTNNCKIMQAEWIQEDETTWVFTVKADRFLRNMVRAIVGTLVEVGRGKMSIEEFRKVIELKDRCKAGASVPGHALFLVDIEYPAETFI